MPSVSPITKSSVTKYLLENKFRAVRQNNNSLCKHHDLYFYGENGNYLGEMTINPKNYGIEVHKLIFEEKLKPIFREYTRVKPKMASFWSKENKDIDEYKPIAYTATRVTIDLKNKTQTKQVIEHVLEQEPVPIEGIKERYGINVYEWENQTFKYKIKSIIEETKPYKWGKYSKYNVFD